ncbi:uncharacterized protein [Antedon mediterranea]|uniref:uncharacterized protein n=1 Tax=Antedon mediterranea TaxID=105859 RepID=UPI003AF5A415
MVLVFEPVCICVSHKAVIEVVKVEYGERGLIEPQQSIAHDSSLRSNDLEIQQYPDIRNSTISVYVEWTKWKEEMPATALDKITSFIVHWGNATNEGIMITIIKTEGEVELPPDQFNITLHGLLPNTDYGIQVIVRRGSTEQLNYNMFHATEFTTIPVPEPTTLFPEVVTYVTLKQHKPTSSRSLSLTDSPSSSALQLVIPLCFLAVLLLVTAAICCRCIIKYRTDHKSLLPGEEMVLNLYETYAQTQSTLQQQSPLAPDRWELPSSCLKIQEVLGEGAFGQVTKAIVERCWLRNSHMAKGSNSDTLVVAVKALHGFAEYDERQNFRREIELMKDLGHHPNVVSLLACCTREEPMCLVVEHCEHGNLLNYLRNHRNKEMQIDGLNSNLSSLTPKDLLSFARQVALGMEYLSQKGFVHRDLAARNILVADNKIAKIGDFGLTRYIYSDKLYLNRRGGKLPIKWMSIEAIFDHVFTNKSDVWSYGVLLSEIVTMGCTPYPAIHNRELLKLLQQGYRMDRPENCSHELYSIMLSCWHDRPDDRPTFTEIRYHLEDMLEQDTPYVDVSIDPYRECFYHASSSSSSSSTSIEDPLQDSETGSLILKVPTAEQTVKISTESSLILKVPTEEELLEKKLECLSHQRLDPHSNVSKNYSTDSGVGTDDHYTDLNTTKHSFV